MKNNIYKTLFLLITIVCVMYGCDYEDVGLDGPSGQMVITGISADSAQANQLVTLTGTGLGSITSVLFTKDSVKASINPTLNTNKNFLFRVPIETIGGWQQIIFTNSIGSSVSYDFNVLAYPTIESSSNFNFSPGEQLTFTGRNLTGMERVVLDETGEEAVIIGDPTPTSITVELPISTTVSTSRITFTNGSGSTTTEDFFVNRDQQYLIFTDDFEQTFQSTAWGDPIVVNTDDFKSGSASGRYVYPNGNWFLMSFGFVPTANEGFSHLSFWIKSDYEHLLNITTSSSGGWGIQTETNGITVTPEWTYFKIPVSDLPLWETGDTFDQIGFKIRGPNDGDLPVYIDDFMFIYE